MKNRRFESNLSRITRPVAAIKSLRFALFSNKLYSKISPATSGLVFLWLLYVPSQILCQLEKHIKPQEFCFVLTYGYDILASVSIWHWYYRWARVRVCALRPWGPFNKCRLTLIAAWISNHMPIKVGVEIAYPFSNFNGCTVDVWEWISNDSSPLYNGCDYLSALGIKVTPC